ncbi:MAG: hypothetical protein IKK09_10210 [Clostridia bacterium]|nr:hypothetical protein [Clostridia bacterium]
MKNKLTCILISVLMFLSVMPLSAFATDDSAIVVTDANGNLLGSFDMLADAVSVACENENSKLTLQKDIVTNAPQDITYGKFTIDLNGKSIVNESTDIFEQDGFEIDRDAELTVMDSIGGGMIYADQYCIINDGVFKLNGGTIKGGFTGIAGGNNAVCEINGGTVELPSTGWSAALYVYGTFIINDGIINGQITNNGSLIINGGTMSFVYNARNTVSVVVNGGTFTSADTFYNCDGGYVVNGGVYPNGIAIKNTPYNEEYYFGEYSIGMILGDGCACFDKNGKRIAIDDNTAKIDGYVKVDKCIKNLDERAVLSETEFEFSGEANKPGLVVDGNPLVEGTDYTVRYNNNINTGTATATFTAIENGYYTGKTTKKFTINPKTIDAVWSETEFTYDGNPHTVTAFYTDVNGNEVEAVISNNTATQIGQYTATASVVDGNYKLNPSTATMRYEIKPDTSAIDNLTVDNVTSDDKAAIEAVKAIIDDNTDEQTKAEYKAITDKCDQLLKAISDSQNSVEAIGIELESFDEERITIFQEDEIQAIKAKIDALLADGNMGETEKATLNGYKAHTDKLIEIINTPAEYISLRMVYFIWDCLCWKFNSIITFFTI